MKVLVTGKNGKLVSYFRKYVQENKTDWQFEFISLRNDEWKKMELTKYDSIIHCAGITSSTNDDYEEFQKINVDLTRNLFGACVSQRTKHFVYLSSMAVYDGIGWGFGQEGLITAETNPKQKSNYGRSKFEAEMAIRELAQKDTKVAIVRAPSIIGGGLEAYFDRYIKFAKIPLVSIPWIHTEAKRSFVYIDTLIDFILSIISRQDMGIFFPQNFPQLSVCEMMQEVCCSLGCNKLTGKWGEAIPYYIQKRYFSQICYEETLSTEDILRSISSQDAIGRTIKEGNK